MLRRTYVLAFALPVAVAALVTQVAACSSDTSADGEGSNVGPGADGSPTNDGSGPNNPGVDGSVPPGSAKGDPCRGQPLPADQHFVTAGLCARLVSAQTSGLRQIMFAPNGDLFGQSANGKIWLFRDADEDGFFAKSEIHAWAETGNNGNNAHVDAAGGFVYAGYDTGIKRFAYDPAATKGGTGENVVINIPSGGGHAKHTTHVYDGFLYVHSGSTGNLSHATPGQLATYDTKRSLIKRFDLSKLTGTAFDWNDGEAFTVGLRNANGFKRNEITKKIYSVVNGSDNTKYKGADVHTDNPGEQVVELAAGKKYGYPYCFTAQRVVSGSLVAPTTQLANDALDDVANPHDDAWCAANSDKPTTFVSAHTAPLDLSFFDQQPQGALPEKWRGGAFIAMHGSWNRQPASGYKVVWQPFNADGTAPIPTSTTTTTTFPYEVVFGGGTVAGGAEDKPWSWSADGSGEAPRPSGVAVGPIDGALYVASDQDGFLYRIGASK